MSVATLIAASPAPLTPDAQEAQRWAENELSTPIYDQQPGLLERVIDWLGQLWNELSGTGVAAPPTFVPVILVALFVLVVIIALLLGGRVQRRRQAERASHQVFDDDRDSDELRAAADEAARRGDWDTAVLERFRSLIRSLDERAVLDDRAGLTAQEAASMGGAALPQQADELRWAGRLFDDVRYGHLQAGPAQDQQLQTLAGAIATARVAAPGGSHRVDSGWAGVR